MQSVRCDDPCEFYDPLNGMCDKDHQQHRPDDACRLWHKPIRRNPMTMEPFDPQEVPGPLVRKGDASA